MRSSRASSSLNFGVQSLQLSTRVVDLELPVDAALFRGGFLGPHADFGWKNLPFADAAASQALAGQATQFAFGHVQPTTVLRRITELVSWLIESTTSRATSKLSVTRRLRKSSIV